MIRGWALLRGHEQRPQPREFRLQFAGTKEYRHDRNTTYSASSLAIFSAMRGAPARRASLLTMAMPPAESGSRRRVFNHLFPVMINRSEAELAQDTSNRSKEIGPQLGCHSVNKPSSFCSCMTSKYSVSITPS